MSTRSPSPVPMTSVATMLLPSERLRVDAAGEGLYRALHRDSVEEVVRDLREQHVKAVVLSVACCHQDDAPILARLVREFPRIPAVALLSQVEPTTPGAVLTLGQSGIRTLVDVRQPSGWRELREVLASERSSDIDRLALGQLSIDLVNAPADCWQFFELLFTPSVRIPTIRALAARLHVVPSTLMSRFFRARLPAPKRYLAYARLVRAARVFENPGLSIANVANHLEYSSPQSFGRHVRTMLGLTALEFRRRYDGEGMLQRFREELILPYLGTLRRFSPLAAVPTWDETLGMRASSNAVEPAVSIARS